MKIDVVIECSRWWWQWCLLHGVLLILKCVYNFALDRTLVHNVKYTMALLLLSMWKWFDVKSRIFAVPQTETRANTCTDFIFSSVGFFSFNPFFLLHLHARTNIRAMTTTQRDNQQMIYVAVHCNCLNVCCRTSKTSSNFYFYSSSFGFSWNVYIFYSLLNKFCGIQ